MTETNDPEQILDLSGLVAARQPVRFEDGGPIYYMRAPQELSAHERAQVGDIMTRSERLSEKLAGIVGKTPTDRQRKEVAENAALQEAAMRELAAIVLLDSATEPSSWRPGDERPLVGVVKDLKYVIVDQLTSTFLVAFGTMIATNAKAAGVAELAATAAAAESTSES